MKESKVDSSLACEDPRFLEALTFFNSGDWYSAHDAFEELWHESSEPERRTLQGLLQVSVAQLHLERRNLKGAMILFGEGLGRLKSRGTPDLGLNIEEFSAWLETHLEKLRMGSDPEGLTVPVLIQRNIIRS